MPASFNKERPGFAYSHVKHEGSIEDNAQTSQLPKLSGKPSVQAGPREISSFVRRQDAPKKLHDYIMTDAPQLSLHIVSFTDATLVSLTWLHTLLDIIGQAAIFDAWTLVLSGQEHRVIPLHGFDSDPLATLGSSPVSLEQSLLAKHQLTTPQFILFAVRFLWELACFPKDELRTVCLPASYLHNMKQTALQELLADEESKRFVSDGDIICAWFTRLATKHLSRSSSRTVVITNVLGLRTILSNDLLPKGTAYVSNATSMVQALVPASQVFQKPLSFTASKVRQSIQEQGTRNQVEAFSAFQRKAAAEKKRTPALFGDATSQLIVFTNWAKGKFYEVDFSSAVVNTGKPLDKRTNPVGRPSHVQVIGRHTAMPDRYTVTILGKDAGGNYWLTGRLRPSTWQKIEKEFASM